jgi:PAS domain S-box-containing protein
MMSRMADPAAVALGAFFSAARAAIVEIDAAGTVRAWNPAAERLLGWRSDEVIGRELPIVKPSDVLRFQLFRRAVLSGDSHAVFEDVLNKTGDHVPVRIWQTPAVDEAGRIAGVWMMIVRANERERALEQRRAILETSLDAAITSDDQGRVRFWSQRAAQMFGWSAAEATSRKLSELIIPERYRAEHERGLEQFARDGTGPLIGRRIEIEAQHRDGHEFPIELSVSTLNQPGRRAAVAFVRDITERRQAEQQLLHANEFRRRVLESTSDAIAAFDLEGCITLVNRRLCELTGHEEKNLVGTWIGALICEESRATVTADFARAAAGESIVGGRAEMLHEDHGSRSVTYNFTPLVEDGTIVGVVGTASDITEMRRLEAEYYQAQRLESIGRLAGGIAHDFNNLMGAVFGYAELIQDELGPRHPARSDVEEIRRIAERATRLTRQLLDFSRRRAPAPQVVVIQDMLNGLAAMVGRLLREDTILRISVAPSTGSVCIEPSQLEQVIINLVVNARAAMPDGGVLSLSATHVAIEAENAATLGKLRPGAYVMVSVTDTGTGMTPEVRERIFEPFYTTKPRGEGTGLGLATSYGIIKRANGHIHVYSEPGVGTSFHVYLPRVPDAPSAQVVPAAPPPPRGDETLLLIEDDESVRRMTLRILRSAGYTVLEAGNGQEGLQVARAYPGPIHMVISDVVMPLIGGNAVVEELRSERPDACYLLTSGYAEDSIESDEGPRMPFLPKPYSGSELTRKVREVLDGRESSPS